MNAIPTKESSYEYLHHSYMQGKISGAPLNRAGVMKKKYSTWWRRTLLRICRISRATGVSRATVHRMLPRHSHFANVSVLATKPELFDCILLSDQKSLRRIGVENPRIIRNECTNFWAGIVGGRLIGPFELPARLNGETYLEFLQENFQGLLEKVSHELRDNVAATPRSASP